MEVTNHVGSPGDSHAPNCPHAPTCPHCGVPKAAPYGPYPFYPWLQPRPYVYPGTGIAPTPYWYQNYDNTVTI
jgi:hypothetical protein